MPDYFLPAFLKKKYTEMKDQIVARLEEFSQVPESDYFYEFCFCILTPQSRARNAMNVVEKLKEMDFYGNPFNPASILRNPAYYIRFHNTKAKRLVEAVSYFPDVLEILRSDATPQEKRLKIIKTVDGFGMKESSHFLRNIGYTNLAILDRHILKHLTYCGVLEAIPSVTNTKKYLDIEKKFQNFAEFIGIPIDELDILFWSYESGEILK